MATYDMKINGTLLKFFGATLLDYSVGPCDYGKGYVLPSGRMIPVKLKPKVGLRTISVTMDFDGRDRHEIALNISKMTAELQSEAKLVMPDGFNYWCEFDGVSAPKEKADWIQQVKFTLSGLRHGPIDEIVFAENCSVYASGNYETPATVRITPAENVDEIIFNGIKVRNVSGPVVIDGVYTTITDENGHNIFADSDITEWPMLKPGENAMTLEGIALVEMSYYPIYM